MSAVCPVLPVLVVTAAAACGPGDPSSGRPTLWTEADVWGTREVTPVTWDSLWTVGGEEDTLLFSPLWMTADREGVYVYDSGRSRVIALSTDGSVRWVHGREGRGPDEFANVRDIKAGPDGRLWVLDPGNGRITGLSDSGDVVRRLTLRTDGFAERFAPLPDGGFLLFTFAREEPVVRVGPDGEPRERFDFAWKGFNDLSPLQSQGLVAASGDRVAFLFSVANGWFPIEEGRSARVERYVEHAPFPGIVVTESGNSTTESIAERPPCSACSAYVAGDTLTIHAGGRTGGHHAVLDRYDWDSGEYLGSLQLPIRASKVAAAGPRHYLLVSDPYPRVRAYSVREAEAAMR